MPLYIQSCTCSHSHSPIHSRDCPGASCTVHSLSSYGASNVDIITYLHKVVNSLQIGQVIIFKINTNTEEESCIASVHNLEVAKLSEKT